jgi:hypothetical protein
MRSLIIQSNKFNTKCYLILKKVTEHKTKKLREAIINKLTFNLLQCFDRNRNSDDA